MGRDGFHIGGERLLVGATATDTTVEAGAATAAVAAAASPARVVAHHVLDGSGLELLACPLPLLPLSPPTVPPPVPALGRGFERANGLDRLAAKKGDGQWGGEEAATPPTPRWSRGGGVDTIASAACQAARPEKDPACTAASSSGVGDCGRCRSM